MFEIFASTSCSVHRESRAGDTKKLLIGVSLRVKCILAVFWRFLAGEKKFNTRNSDMVLHNCTAKAKCCSK